MPGIASDRSPGIQIGPIASIGSDITPTPAVGDMMDAFRSGFITVDDLKKRVKQEALDTDAMKTQLQAGDIQRKLAPGAAENALAQQSLTADQIRAAQAVLPGATKLTLGGQTLAQQEQDRQAALTSDDVTIHQKALEDATKRQYIDTFGHEPPKSIAIPNPKPVDPFDVWLEKEHGADLQKRINEFDPGVPDPKELEATITEKVNNFKSGYPLNSREDNIERAKFANQLEEQAKNVPNPDALRAQFANQAAQELRENPAIRTQYETYKLEQSNAKDKVVLGTPEHTEIMRQRIQDAQDKAALRAAKITALPKVLEEQATLPGKLAQKEVENKGKAAGDVLLELHKSESLKRFEPQFEAFEKVDSIRNSGRPPTNADDIAVLYEFVKLLDPTSAVREGEAKLAQSTVPGVKAMYNKVLGLFTDHNKIMDPQARESMFQTMDTLRDGAIKTVAPEIKRISNIAIDRGVPLDQVFSGPYQAILTKNGRGPGAAPAGNLPPPGGSKRVIPSEGPYKGKTLEWDGARWTLIGP
jgi:hypothetical protein